MRRPGRILAVAIINDHPLVVEGLTSLLAAYADRLALVRATTASADLRGVDVVLFDTVGSMDAGSRLGQVLATTRAKVLVAALEAVAAGGDLRVAAPSGLSTVKAYVRTAYRQASVTSRSQAVLWGIDHGFHHP